VRNKTDGDEPEKFSIVGSTEANPFEGKIGNESPVGRAVLGKKKGDVVTVQSPSGVLTYEILSVA
jgi:transcription elongation factor GreA